MYSQFSHKKFGVLSLIFGFIFILVNCTEKKEPPPETGPTPYEFNVPPGFPPPIFNPENPMTNEGVALGKMLYYDPILSSNGLTCSTCHDPKNSFSSGNFVNAKNEKINILPHVNLSFNKSFFWDGSLVYPDEIPLGDFEPEFFNTNKDTLYARLSKHALYPSMFKNAFGVSNIYDLTYDQLKLKIAHALIQYARTLVTANSRFDQYRQKKITLTTEEQNGMVIFFTEKGDCFHCHTEPLLTDNDYHNNGLESEHLDLNQGRFLFTKNPADLGKFRTQTLRNVEKTAPYMHDGRFNTLDEVVEFYNSGVKNSGTIDPIMTKSQKMKGLNLNAYDKACLVAFLKTFTDQEFLDKHNK